MSCGTLNGPVCTPRRPRELCESLDRRDLHFWSYPSCVLIVWLLTHFPELRKIEP